MTMSTDLFHNPHRYGDMDDWRREALELHASAPIHLVEADGFRPFWAVIGHDEVMQVERQPKLFTNEPYPVLSNEEAIAASIASGGPQRGEATPEEITAILLDFYGYFSGLTADRQASPRDDLATLIATGTIDDEPMPVLEQMGYYTIVATAGHDTTAASMAEGMYRLATNPEALRRLQDEPDLIANAVEEMIRLASPVRHFMRHAQEDNEIAGQPIAAGDWVMLNYTAANLDPRLFDDPLAFDVARPNADKHVAFGFGIHFCLGAQLARMELRSLFTRLIPEIESVELDGEPATSKAVFVSGHKRLPIRYTLRAA